MVRRNDPDYLAPGWWTWIGAGLILVGLLSRYASLPKLFFRKSRNKMPEDDATNESETKSDEVTS